MALRAMSAPRSYIDEQLEIWRERRDLIFEGLRDLGLDLWKPEGAFYVLPKVDNPKELVSRLYFKYGVITYLGDWFGAPGRIRLSYALDKQEIQSGLIKISECLDEMGRGR